MSLWSWKLQIRLAISTEASVCSVCVSRAWREVVLPGPCICAPPFGGSCKCCSQSWWIQHRSPAPRQVGFLMAPNRQARQRMSQVSATSERPTPGVPTADSHLPWRPGDTAHGPFSGITAGQQTNIFSRPRHKDFKSKEQTQDTVHLSHSKWFLLKFRHRL